MGLLRFFLKNKNLFLSKKTKKIWNKKTGGLFFLQRFFSTLIVFQNFL